MARHNTRTKATVLLALAPLMLLTGCSSVLGLGPRLAPEDEPYLFDRWDPDFELAKPCEDITDEELEAAGLEHSESDQYFAKTDGRDDCSFSNENVDSVILSGSAYKIAVLERDGLPVNYQANPEKEPVFVYKQDDMDDGCTVAAETPRGTVEVNFNPSVSAGFAENDVCENAEYYFDLLIGEKLNEYRAN